MRPSRFERKLLLALVAVAVVPMLGAMFLGHAALREAYDVGVNARVRGQLESELSLYRDHFTELRRHADDLAAAIADDGQLGTAVAAGDRVAVHRRLVELRRKYAWVVRLWVVDRSAVELGASGPELSPASDGRRLELARPVGSAGATLYLAVDAPAELFSAYQRAGEVVEVFRRLERSGGAVSNYYLLVYMGFLLSVIALAVAVGVVLSRRVTRRVAILAEATARVGAGDLQVQVPTDVNDEVGELTRAFNAMVRDLRESRNRIEYLRRIGAWQEFARRLAHEIKNPLTPIQLAVQEISRSYRGDDDLFRARLSDAVTIVEEEVATLRRLVSEFSDFARMPVAEVGAATLRGFLSDAARSLEAIADQYKFPNGERVGEVRCRIPSDEMPVRIDAMMLKRGLDNLVRNALQALRDAERCGHVEVSAARQDRWAVVRITDDGPGVPESYRERIFDPYVTTKADGTGLGLAIAKKIVFEHGGEIRCDTNENGGATFSIRLPIAEQAPAPTPSPSG